MAGHEKQLIAFPVHPGVTPLDVVGPLTVLRNLSGTPYRTVVVGERIAPTETDTRMRVVPAATFAEVPRPYAVVVPGGGAATLSAMEDEALLGYVRSTAGTAELVGSTGAGALVLAAAGVLEGRRAAVHWAYADLLESRGVTYAPERWVADGRFLTAAGGSAGIDMMLALLARLKSRSAATLAQLFMEYDPEPPFGPSDRSGDGELARLLRTSPAADRRRPARAEELIRMPAATGGERTIAVVLYPGLTLLDLVGPLQVLTELERFAPQYRTVVVAARIEPMATDVGAEVVPDQTFAQVPHPYAIVVPGGRGGTIRSMSDPEVRGYVRAAAASAAIVGSVCTGSLILASVGLLAGRPATTNWFFSGVLRPFGAHYHRKRWVEHGNVIMSAGVSAGIDMALYLAARLTDEATARRVQRAIDYDPQPPFGGIDWGHVPLLPRAMRGAVGLAAPVIAARPMWVSRVERRSRRDSTRAAVP
ncbi:DJ-1/PfpI family protein [Blastococcus colisei]|uniref:DJ-1/PfpI family protein n=1 Tax=Blastococcus colisei TaxID=1564162 RepID=A0A543PD10_9ACTN|nr:DJ-1/PfpI family protein [Blastococcus colisei]TQN41961.1 DJ-1/PfpI family protein [Blastococcus colisei]